MSARRTFAVTIRVLLQVRRDPRTLALLVMVPSALMTLLWWVYRDTGPVYDHVAPALLAIFPFTAMFLVTSVTMLRERSSGTLERLMSMPLSRADLLVGYGIAFGLLAAVQSGLAVAISVKALGLSISGSIGGLLLVAVTDAFLGTALGLFVSAFATTEFQAVQFMPALVMPQILLCGLLVARADLPPVLHGISDALPLSYAVDAVQRISTGRLDDGRVWRDLLVALAFAVGMLVVGALTLRRRTP